MLVYREEIDGLRAVAIIPVILYHAGFTHWFAGGYIGVDIFFVISGYLITSMIKLECEHDTFSLIQFYERRCRRILPALFLILFLCSYLAFRSMMPEQLHEYGQSLLSILCLSSNIFFWWKDDGYFTRLTELNPLVHTWSLAVEEQFYLFFPLLCYYLRHRQDRLISITIGVSLISFSLAQWGGNLQTIHAKDFQMFSQHWLSTFYLPFGRLWELLIGSLVAFYYQMNAPSK